MAFRPDRLTVGIMSAVRTSLIVIALALLGIASRPADAADVTLESLLDEMLDFQRLAEFPDPPYTCAQFSSYDRAATTPDDPETWFANYDRGQYLRFEEHDGRREGVMMDAGGPGAVVRIWSANPQGVIRIYLDHAEAPALEMPMTELLSGDGPVGAPLTAVCARGWNCYLPIPYAEHCTITCDKPDGVYYQINYRTYAKGTDVETFEAEFLETKRRPIAQMNVMLERVSLEAREYVRMPGRVEPGQRITLFERNGPGAIAEIKLRPYIQEIEPVLRGLVLIGEFDGQRTIHCPLGDFLGTAPGMNAYSTLPFEVQVDWTMTCRWFMPFKESARLELVNTTDLNIGIRGVVGVERYEFNDRSMYFHALWRADGPVSSRPKRDINYATLKGRGVWVGDALSIANSVPVWWGEGDEKIYVDGESFPSHFGTGTEDYYGYAWGSNETFSSPFHAQPRCDGPSSFGFTSVNRFRMLDAIPFTESLRFDMELWHWRDTPVYYAITTYFYGRDIEHNFPDELDPAMLTVPDIDLHVYKRDNAIEGEDLRIISQSPGCETVKQQLGDGSQGSWSNLYHLWCKAMKKGQIVTVNVPIDEAGRYEVIPYFTRSFDYGVVQCFINGRPAGEPIDTFNVDDPDAIGTPVAHSLGVHDLPAVGFTFMVKVVGSNEQSKHPGTYWGLDCIVLKKVDEAGEP
jgi:hypothetical protein